MGGCTSAVPQPEPRTQARTSRTSRTSDSFNLPALEARTGLSQTRSSTGSLLAGDTSGAIPVGLGGASADSALGVQWSSPLGTHVGAELQLERAFAGPSSANDGAVVLSVAQPLL